MAAMPVTAIALIAYSAWAPHYKTCPPCMPDWCNRLAQHPFKVQTRGSNPPLGIQCAERTDSSTQLLPALNLGIHRDMRVSDMQLSDLAAHYNKKTTEVSGYYLYVRYNTWQQLTENLLLPT